MAAYLPESRRRLCRNSIRSSGFQQNSGARFPAPRRYAGANSSAGLNQAISAECRRKFSSPAALAFLEDGIRLAVGGLDGFFAPPHVAHDVRPARHLDRQRSIRPMVRPLRVMIRDSPRSSRFKTDLVSWCNCFAVIVLTDKSNTLKVSPQVLKPATRTAATLTTHDHHQPGPRIKSGSAC